MDSSFRPISDYVRKVARARSGGSAQARASQLFALARVWKDIAPDYLTRTARPIRIRATPDGSAELILACDRDVALDALYAANIVLAKVNAFFGENHVSRMRTVLRPDTAKY